ncbi:MULTISPECIES: hemerythrin domain-containing protein [Actinomadura]|uniref:Hemerythrin domain-containing protein n=1 Tax=Actinomadura yumaensis TaxID=111807 RepID=A0ABW2CFZ6_9ACTN|nr:hemerythrin domain-containing protein [Actinomadura sp. J1-007]MWK34753.1 hemerythrin domain-containing protein [Actinomadura sp. J1-007]
MADDRRDVIEVLAHDHREVEEMFEELSGTADPGQRRRITDDITIELVRHSVAEEMYLYPAARERVPGGDEIADRELTEHADVERILKDLEKADTAGPDFPALVRRLMDSVTEHIQEEETVLFPKLVASATGEELLELGDKVQSAKRRAPTRPHPSAPDKPPLNKLLAPGAGLVDRVRDHLSGRGQD